LLNAPHLADDIPGYQTEFMFRRDHPEPARGDGVQSSQHLWVTPDRVEISQSSDGHVVAFGSVEMRFNIRQIGSGGRDVATSVGLGYQALLTSLYDKFAVHYPAIFHQARETAKLSYAAAWLKGKGARLPPAGRAWTPPATVPGLVFVTWSPVPPRLGAPAVAASAVGGFKYPEPAVNVPLTPFVRHGAEGDILLQTCGESVCTGLLEKPIENDTSIEQAESIKKHLEVGGGGREGFDTAPTMGGMPVDTRLPSSSAQSRHPQVPAAVRAKHTREFAELEGHRDALEKKIVALQRVLTTLESAAGPQRNDLAIVEVRQAISDRTSEMNTDDVKIKDQIVKYQLDD